MAAASGQELCLGGGATAKHALRFGWRGQDERGGTHAGRALGFREVESSHYLICQQPPPAFRWGEAGQGQCRASDGDGAFHLEGFMEVLSAGARLILPPHRGDIPIGVARSNVQE